MSRLMWDMSNMIVRGVRSGHGKVSMISTGKELQKSGKKKKQPGKKIADSVSAFQNLKVAAEEPVPKETESVQEMKTEEKPVLEAVIPITEIHKEDRAVRLRKAVLWSEILGEPTAKKRQRKRMEQRYGNQSYAGRR